MGTVVLHRFLWDLLIDSTYVLVHRAECAHAALLHTVLGPGHVLHRLLLNALLVVFRLLKVLAVLALAAAHDAHGGGGADHAADALRRACRERRRQRQCGCAHRE